MGILMEAEVISREIIRPSSPTPLNLRTFKISLLDQLIPHSIYTPIIFFYPPNSSDNNPKVMTRLKNSLSKTLSEFYPLAGRIKDHTSIDCNDEGIFYFEAKVNNCHDLCEFLKQPEINVLYKFLPCPFISLEPMSTLAQVAIQLNIFSCGGVAIGMCFLHKIIDGITISAFVKRWAAINASFRNDDDEQEHPYSINGAANVIPSIDSQSDVIMPFDLKHLFKKGKGAMRRFVFDVATLSILKAKAASTLVPNPTRVEVVSGIIWKHAMAAAKAVLGSQKSSILNHAVNLRKRMVPPLSENTVGNIFLTAMARNDSNPKEEIELHRLVASLRDAVAEVDNYSRQLQLQGNVGVQEISKFFLHLMCSDEKMNVYTFTSWCRMGFNEVDFGWGKPAWVSSIDPSHIFEHMFMNSVILMDSILNDGIEAWILIGEHEMAILECDPEFLKFASFNPSTVQTM